MWAPEAASNFPSGSAPADCPEAPQAFLSIAAPESGEARRLIMLHERASEPPIALP